MPGLNRTWRKRAPRLSGAGNFWMSKFQGKSVQENNVLGNRIPSILLGKFVAQSSSQNSAFGILVCVSVAKKLPFFQVADPGICRSRTHAAQPGVFQLLRIEFTCTYGACRSF